MKNPFFSIIIATYNAENEITQTIKSLDSQTFSSFELIIIDGLSSDNTVGEINKFSKKISYFISEKDKGVFDAWNKGLKETNADWIIFLGAGDVLLPKSLESYYNFLKNEIYTELDYCSSRIIALYDSRVNLIGQKYNWSVFRKYMNVAHVGSVHSKSIFKKYGFFNINYKLAGDYELLLRPKANLIAKFLDKITVVMPMDGQSNRVTKVLTESYYAKITSGGQSKFNSYIHFLYSRIIMIIKNYFYYNTDFDKRGKINLDE
jgi:glycosyltransferase involved in cell wall biosynthesis